MSLAPRKCSKCPTAPENTQHLTHSCHRKWPFWEYQVCDICFKPGHSCVSCTKKTEVTNICNICGHNHLSKLCPFKNDPDPDQYTKEKYNEFKSKNPQINRPPTAPPTSQPGTSQTPPLTASSAIQPQAQPRPPGSMKQGEPYVPPAKTEKQVEEEKWAGGFQELVHRQSTSTTIQSQGQDSVAVQANYFKVNFDSRNLDLRRYRIDLDQINSKDVIKRELRRALIKALLEQNPPSGTWVSDYFEYIVSVGKLYPSCSDTPGTTILVLHHRPGQNGTWFPMQSSIIYEGSFQKGALQTHVNSDTSSFVPDAKLRMMNIMSWFNINGYNAQNAPLFDGFRVGKRFYPPVGGIITEAQVPKSGQPIFHVRTGFFTSMRPGIGSVLLNVNTATSAFFPPEILHNWITKRFGCNIPPDEYKCDLKALRVTFIGDVANPKTRVIRDVSSNNVKGTSFTPTDANGIPGRTTSVHAYMVNSKFIQVLNQDIGVTVADLPCSEYRTLRFNPQACCLNMGTDNDPKWYPADNLSIVQGQMFKKQLPDDLGSDMREIAENQPEKNKKLILQGALPSLRISPSTNPFSQFGFSVEENFVEVVPKYLCQPTLAFGKDESLNISGQEKNKSSWKLRRGNIALKFVDAKKTSPSPSLHIIRLETPNNASPPQVKQFSDHLISNIKSFGIEFNGDVRIEDAIGQTNNLFPTDRLASNTSLSAALTGLRRRNKGSNPTLLLVVVPNKDKRTYANIKWWGDCIVGIPTICISKDVLNKDEKKIVGVIANISLNINFKMRGTSHHLKDQAGKDILWAGAKPNTMIVGADVSHAGKGSDATCPSMAGVVATYDQRCSQYLASARLQGNNTESIADLGGMIGERLDKYRRVNGALPEHILFYRDGVSESQYGMVVTDELPLIRAGCKAAGARAGMGENWCPPITLLVVGKRHHTRFFPKVEKPEKNNHNLNSGLLIDTGVVTPNHFSFYLQSHDSGLGTAKSAHYIVITNESQYTAREIQETTNKICFTGSRAFNALSVCTPAKYADILCDRLRCYMQPALHNIYAVTTGQAPHNLDFYRRNPSIWIAPGQTRTNPWHPNLNDIMFYL
ncbi:hypothetical protein NHQ30_005460 [Ciborinia camelliae]|nr:hypothetical protein NHQ30_005460 [Ciborinia camelliae]